MQVGVWVHVPLSSPVHSVASARWLRSAFLYIVIIVWHVQVMCTDVMRREKLLSRKRAVAVSRPAWEGAEAFLGEHCSLINENTLAGQFGQARPLGRAQERRSPGEKSDGSAQ